MANKHAMGIAEKEARKTAILLAARALFLKDPRRFPSVAAVAAQAGLAKGTIYLYFATKEEIFTTLLANEWEKVFVLVSRSFTPAPETATTKVDRFIQEFVGHLQNEPNFLRLDALGYGLMEANLPLAQVVDYKRQFGQKLAKAGLVVGEALDLPAGRGVELLVRSHALAAGLWQALDYEAALKSTLIDLSHPLAELDFTQQISNALKEYWRGALG